MIAKSDVIILVVSAAALAGGVYRWQSNMASLAPIANTVQQSQAVASASPNASNTQLIGASATQVAAQVGTQVGTQLGTQANTQAATQTISQTAVQGDNPSATVSNGTTLATSTQLESQNSAVTAQSTSSSEPLYGVYTVQAGDFLGKIAGEFGTTVDTLRSINNIEGSLIDIGQEIRYPLPAN